MRQKVYFVLKKHTILYVRLEGKLLQHLKEP